MKMTKEVKSLVAKYAVIHRQIRVAKYNDYNLDVTIAFACEALINSVKHLPYQTAIETLRDEVAYEGECLTKILAQK